MYSIEKVSFHSTHNTDCRERARGLDAHRLHAEGGMRYDQVNDVSYIHKYSDFLIRVAYMYVGLASAHVRVRKLVHMHVCTYPELGY